MADPPGTPDDGGGGGEAARPLVYVDTSVPNAYFDRRWRERMRVTRDWWRHVRPSYRAAISDVVLDEIKLAPARRRASLVRLVADTELLVVPDAARLLAADYLAAGLLPARRHADALHVAVATVHGAAYLVTWNIRHMASAARRVRIRVYNQGRGLASPELVTPEELRGAQEPA